MPTVDAGPFWLRPFMLDDVSVLKLASTDLLIPKISSVPSPYTDVEGRKYLERQWGRFERGEGYSFAIADAGTDTAVGQIAVRLRDAYAGRVQVGFWVAEPYRRDGAATHALRGISIWALTLAGIDRIEMHVEPGNRLACRVAERVGYQLEGRLRRWQQVDGVHQDVLAYSLLQSDPIKG